MAVYGAPLPLKNHAWAAIQSALDMRQRLGPVQPQPPGQQPTRDSYRHWH